MERILVPIDFSDEAHHALDLAYQIARKSKSQLILTNVIEHPTSTSFSALGEGLPADMGNNIYILQLLNKTKNDFQALVNDPTYSDIDIHYDIMIGNPYKSIAKMISEKEVDLVIMGSRGSSGMDEVLIGSNAEKVVRHSKCPVIIVKEKVNVTDIDKIVFASDFSGDNDHIVPELKKLQKVFVGKLNLVRINTPNSFLRDKDAKYLIGQFIEKYQLDDCSVHIYNDLTEEDGIIAFSEEIQADLIALSTHGRTGFMHLLSGSIAEDIVNHAKRPVWTMKLD